METGNDLYTLSEQFEREKIFANLRLMNESKNVNTLMSEKFEEENKIRITHTSKCNDEICMTNKDNCVTQLSRLDLDCYMSEISYQDSFTEDDLVEQDKINTSVRKITQSHFDPKEDNKIITQEGEKCKITYPNITLESKIPKANEVKSITVKSFFAKFTE